MMAERVAIVGCGQTKHDTKRDELSMHGLVREAATRALDDANMGWADIDAVVIGKAPDTFEGVMMPELFLADSLAAAGKPLIRVHTAGSVGGSTAMVAANLVKAGVHERVLTVAFEKQSESNAMWALAPVIPFAPPLVAGAGGYFAPYIRAYIQRSGAPDDIGIRVALKDTNNGLLNPYAHKQMKVTYEEVRDSIMLWDPVRFLETCPSSDGAAAMVMTSEAHASSGSAPPAWIHAMAWRSEPTMLAHQDKVNPRAGRDCAADVYAQAGISDPRREIDVAEVYVPFSWFEPKWIENLGFAPEGEGWKLTEDGATAIDGDIPWNPSGGVICSNPIGASGMLRFMEAAMQVRGQCGEHQIDGAGTALGHAYGGGSQFFAMWIVRNEKP
ncbi:MAG: thiolase domain-containing protein [Acidimicrobiia bacterium]|nr:thiolase domain-containing protein [Acidimicrobiia bacterium]